MKMKVDVLLKGNIMDRIHNKKDTELITASNLGGNYYSDVQNLKKLHDEGNLISLEIPTTNNPGTVSSVYSKAIQNPRLQLYEKNGRIEIVFASDDTSNLGTRTRMTVSSCQVIIDKELERLIKKGSKNPSSPVEGLDLP